MHAPFNRCAECDEIISNPLCSECLAERMKSMVQEYNPALAEEIIGFAIDGDTTCISCGQGMGLCAHCFSRDIYEYLQEKDSWVMNCNEVLYAALAKIKAMQAANYSAPLPVLFPVAGREGHARLQVHLPPRNDGHHNRSLSAVRAPAPADAARTRVPNRGAGRACVALPRLPARSGVLQLLPQPPLPQVPVRCSQTLVGGQTSRSASGGLLPRGLHATGTHQRHRVLQQDSGLWPAV